MCVKKEKGTAPWKGIKTGPYLVQDSGKVLPEYMTSGLRLDCALRMSRGLPIGQGARS